MNDDLSAAQGIALSVVFSAPFWVALAWGLWW